MAVADLVAEVMRQGSCLVLVGMVVREVQTARMGNRRQIQILYSEHEADPERKPAVSAADCDWFMS